MNVNAYILLVEAQKPNNSHLTLSIRLKAKKTLLRVKPCVI